MTVTLTAATAATSFDMSPSESSDSPTDALMFPGGLVGCADWKRFVLISDEGTPLQLAYMQSLDDPNIALVVTNPNQLDPNYAAPLSLEDRADLGLVDGGTQPLVYCTLTVRGDGWLTANLLGPLVVNPLTGTGKQLVLVDSGYSTQFPVTQLVNAPVA
jgi:flagellar assembly factor FliW